MLVPVARALVNIFPTPVLGRATDHGPQTADRGPRTAAKSLFWNILAVSLCGSRFCEDRLECPGDKSLWINILRERAEKYWGGRLPEVSLKACSESGACSCIKAHASDRKACHVAMHEMSARHAIHRLFGRARTAVGTGREDEDRQRVRKNRESPTDHVPSIGNRP